MKEVEYEYKNGKATKTEKHTLIRWECRKDPALTAPPIDWATFDLDLTALPEKYILKTMLAFVLLPCLVFIAKFKRVRF